MAIVIDIAAEQERWTGMFRQATVHTFGADQHGLHAVTVAYPNSPVDIQIRPRTYGGKVGGSGNPSLSFDVEAANDAAQSVAVAIQQRLGEFDYDCARLRCAIEDKRAAVRERDEARRKLAKVIEARNPQPRDDLLLRGGETATAPVWLHGWEDKPRGGSAFGYWFSTPEAFWRAHPELRPVEWGQDEHGPWLRLRHVSVKEDDSG